MGNKTATQKTKRIHQLLAEYKKKDSVNSVCPKCGDTGRCEPRTLSDPDGQECDCNRVSEK